MHICFPKKGPETPIFIVFLGARFLGQGVTEKLIFGYFCCFFWLLFFLFFLFFFFLFLFFFVLFFGCLIQKNLVFPLEKGIFCLFSVFLFLSPLACFGLPLFVFLFVCLSLFFFSFFLPSCLSFLLSFGSLFLSLSFFFFLLCFFFHERNNIKIFNCKFFLHQYFLFFGFLSFFLSSSFFLSLLFPDFELCFLFNIKVLGFKTDNLKKQTFLVKREVATKRFFLPTCVLQNVKSYRYFLAIFGWCSKNTIKIRYFSTFVRAKNWKKGHF